LLKLITLKSTYRTRYSFVTISYNEKVL